MKDTYNSWHDWRTQEKNRGVPGYARPDRGSGRGRAPERQRIYENLQTNSLMKLQKCSILAYFSKGFKNPEL